MRNAESGNQDATKWLWLLEKAVKTRCSVAEVLADKPDDVEEPDPCLVLDWIVDCDPSSLERTEDRFNSLVVLHKKLLNLVPEKSIGGAKLRVEKCLLRDRYALHVAARRGDMNLLSYVFDYVLRKPHQRPWILDRSGRTPLHWAAERGNFEVVRQFRYEVRKGYSRHSRPRSLAALLIRDQAGLMAIDLCKGDGNERTKNVYLELSLWLKMELVSNVFACSRGDVEDWRDGFPFDAMVYASKQIDFHIPSHKLPAYEIGMLGDRFMYRISEEGLVNELRWALSLGTAPLSIRNKNWPKEKSLLLVAAVTYDPRCYINEDEMETLSVLEGTSRFANSVDTKGYRELLSLVIDTTQANTLKDRLVSICDAQERRNPLVRYRDCSMGRPDVGATQLQKSLVLLVEHGAPMLTFRDIIMHCSIEASPWLISCLLEIYGTLGDALRDSAPVAMDLIFAYIKGEEDIDPLPTSLAFQCVERHFPNDNRDLYQMQLLQWLVETYGLDPIRMRNSMGETLLHVSVRNKLFLTSAWLLLSYNELSRTGSGAEGKLPVQVALEDIPEFDLEVGLPMAELVAGYTECGVWQRRPFRREGLRRLADRDGKSVREYAMNCNNETLARDAHDEALS